MARLHGTRNARHDKRRAELLSRLRTRLAVREGAPASWRELAGAAGVSLSTLSHYFGRRDDVVRAVMEDDFAGGAKPLATMSEPTGPFAQSVADAIEHLVAGFEYGGLDAMFATGLIEGLRHPVLGPAFLTSALEPTLAAIERRLQAHIDMGEMLRVDPRGPAIALIAPIVVAFLHQRGLGGVEVRPLPMDVLRLQHAEAFIRAWRSEER